MTKEQREFVFQIGDEIKEMRRGRFKIYASATIVRVQDTWDNKNYRAFVVLEKHTKHTLRRDIMKYILDMEEEEKK